MPKDTSRQFNVRAADLTQAIRASHDDPSTERSLDVWDKAAYVLANKDPGYKEVENTAKNLGVDPADLNGPNAAGAYLKAAARFANSNMGADNSEEIREREIEGGNITPEQVAQAGAILKKYGVSDPDGTQATGLAYLSSQEASEWVANLSEPADNAPARPQSTPGLNR